MLPTFGVAETQILDSLHACYMWNFVQHAYWHEGEISKFHLLNTTSIDNTSIEIFLYLNRIKTKIKLT
jgi:hypothetical protein